MRLEGLHHITMITGDAQRERRLLRRRARPAAGQEDRQLRRSPSAYHLYFGDETGRARLDPHLVRVRRRRAAAAPGVGHDPHAPARRRLARPRWTSGRSASRPRRRDRARRRHRCASPTPTACALELVVADDGNPPLRAEHPEIPAEHAIIGLEGARAYSAFAPVEETLLTDDARLHVPRRRRVPPRGRAAPLPLGLRPGADRPRRARARAPSTTSPGRRATRTTSRGRRASREAGGYVTDVRDRDYFNVDLLPRAARRAVRDRDALARASPSTRTPSTSARRCACRTQHEHLRAQLERTLTPVVNPRAAREAPSAHERARLPRAPGRRRAGRACSSSTTAAAPTSTTCSASPTCSTRSGGCTSSRRARR